jgi:hypothetical protein
VGGVPVGVFASPRPSRSFDYMFAYYFDYTAKGEVVGTGLGPGVLIHCYMFACYFDYTAKGEFAGRGGVVVCVLSLFCPSVGALSLFIPSVGALSLFIPVVGALLG